ncbi:non-ribosomal peptide synthetase [Planctobacterium marinum]|uniref:non-ribosomal peptide synthetase n=1 Tax=Planctobacterium marinum TaxID=1631968 RepID=UPI001E329CFA|nr:non-ribosomal peptide synthetase [Planctobacterium marinum]MCC2606935.1 amino acid adenylation domain-containing protein [Planctobacterium marinum]
MPLQKLKHSCAPLSLGQQRLWFLDKLETSSAHYNITKALRLSGELNTVHLKTSLEAIIRRHEILRTIYVEDSEVKQLVQENQTLDFAEVDLSDVGNIDQALEDLINAEQLRNFDLSKDSILRATLIKTDNSEWVLVISIHHIACDGWSLNIVVNELLKSYRDLATGQTIELPELPYQYTDVAMWQQKNMDKWRVNSDFWVGYLKDAPKIHELPTDYARPKELSFHGASIETLIEKSVNQSVTEICNKLGVTPFLFYYSVFALIVSRWSGQEDVVIGTPVANREVLGVESLIGYFSNTMVLRTRVETEDCFDALLTKNKANFLDVFAKQHVPFELIVDALELPRNLSHSPIFQIFFSYHSQADSQQTLSLPNLELENVGLKSALSKFDLELSITNADSCPKLNWIYSTELFDESTITRLADSYIKAVNTLADNVSAKIGAIDIIPTVDLNCLSRHFQAVPPSSEASDLSLGIERFNAENHTALICGDNTLSYQQLDQLANQVAHWLRAKKVAQNSVVGVKLPRSVELVAVMLGILRAGAAYLPLEAGYPEQRLNLMAEQCKPLLVIDNIDELYRSIESQPLNSLSDVEISPESLAYVIFTSGSTGTPKGVTISRKNMATFLASFRERYPLKSGVWLAVTGIAFDISVLEIFGALSFGHTIIMTPDGNVEDKTTLNIPALIQQYQVTELQCTPSFAAMHLSQADNEQLQTLNNIFFGGEALSASLVQEMSGLTTASIHNMYGPTEATVWSTSSKVTPSDGEPMIGKPLVGYQCFVLDRNKNRVPAGTPAELFIAGNAVSAGYINNSEETSRRFFDGTGITQQKLYATGDIVSWTLDGNLKYKGRSDNQVKLRGYRIELSEIEHVINLHESVQSSIVAVVGENENVNLVAYIQLMDATINQQAIEDDIKQSVAAVLPHFMIPSQMMFLDKMPQTLNGKIDRKAMPEFKAAISGETEIVTKTEKALAVMWAELLQIPQNQIFQESNFFSLGGHSLLLTKLVTVLNERMSCEVTVRDVFQYPVLKQLAERLEQLQEVENSAELELII